MMLVTTALIIVAAQSKQPLSASSGMILGTIVDETGKPAASQDVQVRTWQADTPTASGDWRDLRSMHVGDDGRFTIHDVTPGECALVAQFLGPSSYEVIVRRFTIASGESKDFGALHAEGPDHTARLTIFDAQHTDITAVVMESLHSSLWRDEWHPRNPFVQFHLTSIGSHEDPPFRWDFARAPGATITARGLDAFHVPLELGASISEGDLLPPDRRAVSSLHPTLRFGKGCADPAIVGLSVAPTQDVRISMTLPDGVVQKSWPADESFICVSLDDAGNLRWWRVFPSETIGLTAGRHRFYAMWWHPHPPRRSIAATGIADIVVNPGEQQEVDLRLQAGVTITGRAVLESGEPFGGQEVYATFGALMAGQRPDNEPDSVPWFVARTRADGTFTLDHVPPGEDLSIQIGFMPYARSLHIRTPRENASIGDVPFRMR